MEEKLEKEEEHQEIFLDGIKDLEEDEVQVEEHPQEQEHLRVGTGSHRTQSQLESGGTQKEEKDLMLKEDRRKERGRVKVKDSEESLRL